MIARYQCKLGDRHKQHGLVDNGMDLPLVNGNDQKLFVEDIHFTRPFAHRAIVDCTVLLSTPFHKSYRYHSPCPRLELLVKERAEDVYFIGQYRIVVS